jgi:hypothetical protein
VVRKLAVQVEAVVGVLTEEPVEREQQTKGLPVVQVLAVSLILEPAVVVVQVLSEQTGMLIMRALVVLAFR